MTPLVEEHQTGSLGLKAEVVLARPCQLRTASIQAGDSVLGYEQKVAGEASSHFGGRLLHCSLTDKVKKNVTLH